MGEGHQITVNLGVRNEESARRASSIAKFELSKESLWSKHSDFKEVMCLSPLKFISSDELWFNLLENTPSLPWGTTIEELSTQYGEGIMECAMKISSEQGKSCGGTAGRLGCWTCGMVSGEDQMLKRC